MNTQLPEYRQHIFSRLRLKLPLQYILITLELGFIGRVVGEFCVFLLQEQQAHEGSAKIAGDTDKVALFCTIPINDLLCLSGAKSGNLNSEPVVAGTGVASDQVDLIVIAGKFYPFVKLLDCRQRKF